ncbi:uncharacterized protein LOC111871577 [Cryptotermes secundus]|uniref:uncharacterized protein LOC111871577 n=1 Tax=Cryptotermes secundus TaxID=105785 RepID=UPI000CD7B2E1|nr:uncharacterized protein LOC111871577 [Cryptotermes secundus]
MDVYLRGRERKRRKSILKNAKKYAKKGKCGTGSYLNEDIYQYYVRVLELLHTNNFETEEEKAFKKTQISLLANISHYPRDKQQRTVIITHYKKHHMVAST